VGWKAAPALTALAMFAGANLTFQALVNTQLRAVVGSPLRASLVSYVGGTLCCIAFILARHESLNVFDRGVGGSNALLWTGGLYGLLYLAIVVWLLPRMGATQLFALVVGGQLVAALILDQFGLFGSVVRPIEASKICGIVLLVVAVYLIRR
jgi:transporter family-2 protein